MKEKFSLGTFPVERDKHDLLLYKGVVTPFHSENIPPMIKTFKIVAYELLDI